MSGERVLVTGGSGFIGSHVVAALVRRRISARVFSRQPLDGSPAEVVVGDIRDAHGVLDAASGCATIIHLAGRVHDLRTRGDSGEHQDVTVRGAENVMRAARSASANVVFISSLAVYGGSRPGVGDENSPTRPTSPYGRAKLEAERLLLSEASPSCCTVTVLRPAMVYGVGCKGNLPRMISAIARHWFPPPPKASGLRSMIHVDNLVAAILLAAERTGLPGRTYVVTDSEPYSIRYLYEEIERALGRQPLSFGVPRLALRSAALAGDILGVMLQRRIPFDTDAYDKLISPSVFSSARIATELGYRPELTLGDAIPEIVAEVVSRR